MKQYYIFLTGIIKNAVKKIRNIKSTIKSKNRKKTTEIRVFYSKKFFNSLFKNIFEIFYHKHISSY